MNELERAVLRTVQGAFSHGEVPVDAVPWHLHEEHGVQRQDVLLKSSFVVIEKILEKPGIVLTELRNGAFIPIPEERSIETIRMRARENDNSPGVPSFGWSDPPQLFFLRRRS